MKIDDLLIKEIKDVSFELYESGYYREAMINSILCLFDMIREESGLRSDGADLIGKAFSLSNPRIILANLKSESGKNIQKGVIQMLQGYFQAYRNVASHSLTQTFDQREVLSILISISRLYVQIKEAEKAVFLRFDGLYLTNEEGYKTYLRFYEDNTIISVSSTGDPEDITNWFNRENAEDFNDFSIGEYEINERTLEFFTEHERGKVIYDAVIRPDTLHVNSKSLINGNESEHVYEFVSWNQI
jgi:uncharacterized protein (TIGR02391 family)